MTDSLTLLDQILIFYHMSRVFSPLKAFNYTTPSSLYISHLMVQCLGFSGVSLCGGSTLCLTLLLSILSYPRNMGVNMLDLLPL